MKGPWLWRHFCACLLRTHLFFDKSTIIICYKFPVVRDLYEEFQQNHSQVFPIKNFVEDIMTIFQMIQNILITIQFEMKFVSFKSGHEMSDF